MVKTRHQTEETSTDYIVVFMPVSREYIKTLRNQLHNLKHKATIPSELNYIKITKINCYLMPSILWGLIKILCFYTKKNLTWLSFNIFGLV